MTNDLAMGESEASSDFQQPPRIPWPRNVRILYGPKAACGTGAPTFIERLEG
jgi:hypothetical protein